MRRRNESGFIGGAEGLAFGVLLFVFGTLMFTTAWGVVDAKLATAAAAREGVRAYVESNDAVEAEANASGAVNSVMAGHGRTSSGVAFAGDFGRCQAIAISVASDVPRIAVPIFGNAGGTYVVTSSHTEVIDPYRSGLAGTATCEP